MQADQLDPAEHTWVLIDVAIAALDVSPATAYRLADREHWKSRPAPARDPRATRWRREYFWPDIVTTYNTRKASAK